jgi:hypothetical protein
MALSLPGTWVFRPISTKLAAVAVLDLDQIGVESGSPSVSDQPPH